MRRWRWVIAFLVSGAGIGFALHGVQWSEVGQSWARVRSPGLLLLIPLACGVEFCFRTERWRLLLNESRDQRRGLFPILAAAFFMNTILPFRAGEAARVYWTHRRTGRPVAGTVAALAVDRLTDSLAVVGLALAAVAGGVGASVLSPGAVRGFLFVGGAGLLFFILLARCSDSITRRLGFVQAPKGVRRFFQSFVEGAAPLRSLSTLGLTLFLAAGVWLLNAGIFIGAARLFGIGLSFPEGALLLAGIALGVALPSTPGFIGTYEAAGVGVLGLLGYEKSIAFPFIACLHLAQIAGTVMWGAPSLFLLTRPSEKTVPVQD